MKKINLKRLFSLSFKSAVIIAVLGFMTVLWCNWRVNRISEEYVFRKLEDVEPVKVGLLLGTSAKLRSGLPNAYFENRIQATLDLFNAGKIKHVLISGDNSVKNYNEPQDMKDRLVEGGIPESSITLDYAGFDTYDSMIRAKKVFGQRKFLVISQEFHVRRAVFIARSFDIEASGFAAADVNSYGGFRTKLRERLARVKAYFEVMFNVQPTFLGEEISIP